MEKYFHILGINSNASLDEVKKAYRKKAKTLHPDRNSSPNANEEFVVLGEAYEVIVNYKTLKKRPQQSYKKSETPEQRIRREQDEARERMRKYAAMRYEAYKKTDHYKNTQAAKVFFNHIYFIFSLALLSTPLWLLYYDTTIESLFSGLFITFLLSPFWAGGIFVIRKMINLKEFKNSFLIISKHKRFHFVVLALLNIYFYVQYISNTQIKSLYLLVIATLIFGLYIFVRKKKFSKSILFIGWITCILNLFFLVNFEFSKKPQSELYYFYSTDGPIVLCTSYNTKCDQYSAYPHMRFYLFPYEMRNTNQVLFTFEEGFFGIRVMKQSSFMNSEEG